jgi:hypothetical protein
MNPKKKPARTLLTKSDAARLAQCTPAAIRAAAESGRLRVAVRTPGGNRLFRLADVEAFAEERAQRAAKTQTTDLQP